MVDISPYALIRGPVDLTSCDMEPVHRIGLVQSHGALLVFGEQGDLLEASRNWSDFLGHRVLPSRLEEAFEGPILESLKRIENADHTFVLPHTLANAAEVSAHRAGERLVVEIESTESAHHLDPIASLNGVMHGLRGAQSSTEFLDCLARELCAHLGIHHVMVYRFLPDWAGEVVAEASLKGPSYLGLRFPSTDIPKPAREVFGKVWVRHIARVDAPAVPVHGDDARLTGMDLTQVGIRAASPIHLEYLANMGVAASLTLSLRMGDRLWGLVACHHRVPYQLRPSARASLEVLAQMASFQLSSHLQNETRQERAAHERRLLDLDRALEASEDRGLGYYLHELESLIPSDMVAVYENRRWSRKAGIPLEALERFSLWHAREGAGAPIFQVNDLPPDLVPGYAGVLALSEQGRLVCWFRREQAHSVRWAGNPHKFERSPAGRLNPRASFAEYIETTLGKSLSFSELDLWKADRVLRVMRTVTLRQHRRLQQRNEALSRSNRELDSFAYMASHDLKEPLRGIYNYATFLKEDYGDRLDGDGIVFLDGLTSLAKKMTVLLDSLLAYSRLNSQLLDIKDCDLAVLARDTVELLQVTRQVELQVREPLPVVQAYPPFLSEILVNLLTNAIKYTDPGNRCIEIGATAGEPGFDTFYVRDNGIGIDQRFHEEIFHLFRRLHGEGERGEGSGVGLTIVQKMVDRHGGRVWVESQPEAGSTFYVALPSLKLPHAEALDSEDSL